ncbi:hypothetical protein FKW77_008835 [Venturia effusa]|uniref:Uncharacterized protein n=1 Tax=Venturia effusa TaxID=50376 RepID=A0A517LEE0_9PEZI|nr:hypothetical protein FKW77_008835 [Venturia effusa]
MSTSTNYSLSSDASLISETESSTGEVQSSSSADQDRYVVVRMPPPFAPHTRAYIWGSALHDNIIMNSKESGLAQAVRLGSFVFLTNIRSTFTADDVHPIFVDLPNLVLMHRRKYAPGLYATTFKVDMPTEYKAKKLVNRLLQQGYIERDIDFSVDNIVFPGEDFIAQNSCSPLGFELARMNWEGDFLIKLQKALTHLGWPEMDRIISQAQEIAAGPGEYLYHLFARVRDSPDSLEEWKKMEEMLRSKNLVWAMVILWEIRLGVQMDLAEDPDFALNWQNGDKANIEYAFVRKCYDICEPAPGWSEFVRNGEGHELEPWLLQEVVEECSISNLTI